MTIGKQIGKIKAWYRHSFYKQWLFCFTLGETSGVGTDSDGDVWATSTEVFRLWTSPVELQKAFRETKRRYVEESDSFYLQEYKDRCGD